MKIYATASKASHDWDEQTAGGGFARDWRAILGSIARLSPGSQISKPHTSDGGSANPVVVVRVGEHAPHGGPSCAHLFGLVSFDVLAYLGNESGYVLGNNPQFCYYVLILTRILAMSTSYMRSVTRHVTRCPDYADWTHCCLRAGPMLGEQSGYPERCVLYVHGNYTLGLLL